MVVVRNLGASVMMVLVVRVVLGAIDVMMAVLAMVLSTGRVMVTVLIGMSCSAHGDTPPWGIGARQ